MKWLEKRLVEYAVGEEEKMRIGIIGGRDFSDFSLLTGHMGKYLSEVSLVVSGGAKGADSLGEQWAKKNEIEILIFHPAKPKKSAYFARNRQIVENSDLIVAFWNGKSSGTHYTLRYAESKGVKTEIVKY